MTLVVSECRPDIAVTLERADAGARLSAQEAYAFEHTTSSELLALLRVADALRARHHGEVITYSRKVFLPLTNLCRDYCGYCTFRKDPGDPGAKTMTPDEVLAVATAGARLGCKEALFSLGTSRRRCFPTCARRCSTTATAAPWTTWCRCAGSCSTRHRCCRTPIRG